MSKKTLTRAVAAAATKRPLCGYLRLTVDRDGKKIGYDVQKSAIERWAEWQGETIGFWYKDKDVTAADHNVTREGYEQMLADVEAGMWGGIVVWRLDRLVRLMFEFERCYKLLTDAGGYIVALDPAYINSKDEMGAIFMRLLVMFAEMEINTMKARQRGHRQKRAEKGMAHGGLRQFGFVGASKDEQGRYLNVGKAGVEHVPEEVELMREAARRIVDENWHWVDVIRDWNSRTPPIRGTTGAPIHIFTLQKMLTGPRAVGKREFTYEDAETGEVTTSLVKAVWEPILDEKTWIKLRALLRPVGPYGPKHTYLLSGILRCGRCKQHLSGAKRRYEIQGEMESRMTYRCKSGIAEKEAGACGKLNVIADPVEKLVIARVLRRIEETPELLKNLADSNPGSESRLTGALAVIEECETLLVDLANQFGERKLPMAEWLAARTPLERDKAEAEKTVEHISRSMAVPVPVGTEREHLLKWFEGLNLTQQRAVLTAFIAEAQILPTGRSGPHFNPGRLVVTLADPQKAAD